MRIEPAGTPATPAPSSTAPAPKPADSGNEAAPLSKTTFVPTGRLASLLAQARSQPEMRNEAIEDAASKLASGELDTPEAMLDTAREILHSPDIQ